MQKREKMIMLAAGAALLYFGIDRIAGANPATGPAATQRAMDCEQFILRGEDTLNAMKSSSELFRRIALLEGGGGDRNPFIRSWLQSACAVEPEASGGTASLYVRYTGFFESARASVVVINGKEYSLNEIIDGTNLTIKQISPEHVVLQTRDAEGSESAEEITILKEVESSEAAL